jgi:hypothetical protein
VPSRGGIATQLRGSREREGVVAKRWSLQTHATPTQLTVSTSIAAAIAPPDFALNLERSSVMLPSLQSLPFDFLVGNSRDIKSSNYHNFGRII